MKYKSQIIASGSGSVAGCTFSHNRYGQYVRNRSIPVNPNSYNQNQTRIAFAALASMWNSHLSQAQRDAWDAYAAAVPRVGPLGDSQYVTGLNWYVACNVGRYVNVGMSDVIDDAPVLFNMAVLGPIAVASLTAATATLSLTFDDTDDWANATGGYLFVAFGLPGNASRNFYKGPFRQNLTNSFVSGDDTTPPTSPAALVAPFATPAGTKLFIRVHCQNADGRYSPPVIVPATAA